MIDRILRLGKETALYGLSTVLGRMLNFLLVPLYAHLLLPEENGVLATLYAYIAFASVVYGLGMEQSFMRFWVDAREEERPIVLRRAGGAALVGVLLSILAHVFRAPLAESLGFTPQDAPLLSLAAVILAADGLAAVPFALLRMQRRPLVFASLKVSNILLTIVGTVYLLAVEHRGIEGVLTANAGASIVTWVACMFLSRQSWHVPVPSPATSSTVRDLWRFGLPLIPAGLAGIALQVVDRPILRLLTDDATVGLYQINFRLGIFMMLFVGMFDFAWRPFFLHHARDADAPSLFARVFTYLMTLLATVFMVVSMFVDDLVRLPVGGSTLFPELYWAGVGIVPWVLLAYVFTGAYVVFLSGTYLDKRTGMIPVISVAAAVADIIGIVLFVPVFGIVGAAFAVAVAHAVQAVGMYVVSRRYLSVPYEWRRVSILAIWTGAVFAMDRLLEPTPMSLTGISLEVGLFAAYLVGLFLLRVVRKEEVGELSSVLRSSRNHPAEGA